MTDDRESAPSESAESVHAPILVGSVLEHLAVRPGGHYVDATANGGGHTRAILDASAPNGRVLALDRDPVLIDRLQSTQPALVASGRLIAVATSFRAIADVIGANDFAPVAGIVFDLGLSSYHLDRSGRGFSYAKDETLDMRFGGDELQTKRGYEILARAPLPELTRIFRELGEERYGSRIARTIVAMRDNTPIRTTTELFAAIEKSLPANTRWRANRHAARVFQGLRIAVNDELTTVSDTLPDAWDSLAPGGRMVVLAFHSLEDRIIKRCFRAKAQEGVGKLLTKKPLVADAEEVALNSRAASAKLRAIEKLA